MALIKERARVLREQEARVRLYMESCQAGGDDDEDGGELDLR